MVARTLKRLFFSLIAFAGVALVIAALFLLTRTVQRSDDFDRLQDLILVINVAGGLLLFALLIGNLWRLLRDYRQNVPGAKLKARMVGMFVGLAVLPLLVVFYFSGTLLRHPLLTKALDDPKIQSLLKDLHL